jgi:DDB1- and CUL4-associated factor 11
LDILIQFYEDGTEVVLWPEKESSLVEGTYGMTLDVMMYSSDIIGMRIPESNNQVFFIDTSGALCSRSSGHALDVEGKDYGSSHNSLT